MSSEKTEKPTAKRLEDARKKGQIARSRDLALAAASVAATFALARLGGHIVSSLSERLAADLSHFGDAPLQELTGTHVTAIAVSCLWLMTVLVGPIALVAIAAGVGTHGCGIL